MERIEDKLRELKTELVNRFDKTDKETREDLTAQYQRRRDELIKQIDDRVEVSKILSVDIFEMDEVWKGILAPYNDMQTMEIRIDGGSIESGGIGNNKIYLKPKNGKNKWDIVVLAKRIKE